MATDDAEVTEYLRSEQRRQDLVTALGLVALLVVGICAALVVAHLDGPEHEVIAAVIILWVLGAATLPRKPGAKS